MKQLLTKYDNLFEVSFPYSMGWHGKTIRKICFGGFKHNLLCYKLGGFIFFLFFFWMD